MNETEILDKIKHNPDDFSEIFTLYYKPIFGYILRRTGSFDDSADIAAETFLKSFKGIKNFNYTGISVKVWLYRIATNEINLYFRKRNKYISVFKKINLDDESLISKYIKDDRLEIEEELQLHEQFLEILRELKTMPVKYQEVISLRYFEGKDNTEIAEILNIKMGTLKSLISRGLEKLRKKCNCI